MSTLTRTSLKTSFMGVAIGSATILAALGAGASSIRLRRAREDKLNMPVAPFILVAFGPMPGARQDVRTLFPTLWLYDDDQLGWARISALADIIEGVYVEDCISYCDTNYAGGIGDELTDAALQRPALAMRYQVRGRF